MTSASRRGSSYAGSASGSSSNLHFSAYGHVARATSISSRSIGRTDNICASGRASGMSHCQERDSCSQTGSEASGSTAPAHMRRFQPHAHASAAGYASLASSKLPSTHAEVAGLPTIGGSNNPSSHGGRSTGTSLAGDRAPHSCHDARHAPGPPKPMSGCSSVGPSKLAGSVVGGPTRSVIGAARGAGCSACDSTQASPRVGDVFAAPPLEPPKTGLEAQEGAVPAACRVCALAEAESSLFDFAPRDKGWWSDALSWPQHSVFMIELKSALRLQQTQRAALLVSTSHNSCVINATLAGIAEVRARPKYPTRPTCPTRHALTPTIRMAVSHAERLGVGGPRGYRRARRERCAAVQ